MGEETCRDQVRVAIPIRVRGMSSENKFFDEQTETDWVGEETVVCHLQNLVDLDTEIHLTNSQTQVGGNFRVLWTSPRAPNGFQYVGLELLNPEGDLWAMSFPSVESAVDAVAPQVWLECQRCRQKLLAPVPEAQGEFLREGFRVARHCEPCRATTSWTLTAEPVSVELEPEQREEQRGKGRVPLEMTVKVTRKRYGTKLEEICQTANVSRTGAYFLTSEIYELGESLQVVLNYQEGALTLPTPAKVVRLDQLDGKFRRGVAIELAE